MCQDLPPRLHVVSIQEVLAAAAVGIKAGHMGLILGCRAKLTFLLHLGLGVLCAGQESAWTSAPCWSACCQPVSTGLQRLLFQVPGPTAPSCQRCRETRCDHQP